MDRIGRRIRSLLTIVVLASVAIVPVSGQTKPVTDGTVMAGEYKIEHVDGPVRLLASFDASHIYLAIVGKTEGWVAVGVGSSRMDGAHIFIGYVANGKEAFSVQRGVRHSHRQSAEDGVLAHALAEAGGSTTMELVLERSAYLGASDQSLDVIYAIGNADSFVRYHAFRGATQLNIR